MKLKSKIIEEIKLWSVPLFIAVILIFLFQPIVIFFPKWFVNSYNEVFMNTYLCNSIATIDTVTAKTTNFNPSITGAIGDTFGGTLGPMIALLAAFLTFLAFWIQYRANRIQENYIKQQRFEDTFFRLLDHYKKNLDSMDIRDVNEDTRIMATGCECFKSMYVEMKRFIGENTKPENIAHYYDFLQDYYKHDLHHYFRFLYHILKFIKQSEISENEKLKYSSILRATMSAYELVFIFYNCLHENGRSRFKQLIEEFSFLKNIDNNLIINIEQKNEYHPIAFSSSTDRHLYLNDWLNQTKFNNTK